MLGDGSLASFGLGCGHVSSSLDRYRRGCPEALSLVAAASSLGQALGASASEGASSEATAPDPARGPELVLVAHGVAARAALEEVAPGGRRIAHGGARVEVVVA